MLEEIDEEEYLLGLWSILIFVNQLDGLVHATLSHHVVLFKGIKEHLWSDVDLEETLSLSLVDHLEQFILSSMCEHERFLTDEKFASFWDLMVCL